MNSRSEVIEWVEGLLPFGIKPGLERMEAMLDSLGEPQQKLKTIHIAGTNGKGSTVSFIRHILEAEGYSVGTFTSPSIEFFEDRISVNGIPISEVDLIATANRIRPLVEKISQTELGSPTEFEVITAIAIDYFTNIAQPDVVLMEVGLGGRLDSTNVITPILSVITSIGYDHMHILGNSLSEIAFEKAGIIKPGVPVVSAVPQLEAKAVIQNQATTLSSDLYELDKHFTQTLVSIDEQKQVFTYQSENDSFDVTIQMPGRHQRENAALAICAVQVLQTTQQFQINEDSLKTGLFYTTWPGRFERIEAEPVVILDGAHNKEGMEALAETLSLHYPDKRYRFVIAATKEKDMDVLLQPFTNWHATFTFTSFPFERAAKAVDLWEQAPVKQKRYSEDWEQVLDEERSSTQLDEVFIICGSLYFISKVREKWKSLVKLST
ncbi:bifunctional folylpolyglutamate synthase/dihydrofolate synthase [Halalkalibacter akibai]|uniref:Dihydrofolate synthase/folylpolyglutamate synthase n=1 Tax=Halalkalibacter akibai (strain ATCC 43226 / DSM 21942 / CIP 109018 / JCM 9157 / 1139) TaxID=1236973 RepID=W4QS60_HALA3|nr:folylpolyglutamate synthase/dihydrofolate synthase family protein [Halalkalibacter akibai]GAE34940.1 dihydrofolate synthase [Halalkalibacter akibai JCM 9157]